jgi:cytochrome P450
MVYSTNDEFLFVESSDTTASSLAATFFYLSRNLDAYDKVASEVRTKFCSVEDIRIGPEIASYVRLRAAIDEAMRLCPVVPQPLWRRVGGLGCTVDGEFIPGGLNVGASIYPLHHNEDTFPDSFTYNYERWLVGPQGECRQEREVERVKKLVAGFAPFSIGPRQCIAKNFAQMELMLVMANVFWRLDFKKASGDLGRIGEGGRGIGYGRNRADEFQFKSHFTSHIHGPMICFRKRDR